MAGSTCRSAQTDRWSARFSAGGDNQGIIVGHYRIYELDPANHILDGYSVVCRSDTAALAMASKGAENHAAAVEVWESSRRVARLDPVTPWEGFRNRWFEQSRRSEAAPWAHRQGHDAQGTNCHSLRHASFDN
jgi:hypothetical protein